MDAGKVWRFPPGADESVKSIGKEISESYHKGLMDSGVVITPIPIYDINLHFPTKIKAHD